MQASEAQRRLLRERAALLARYLLSFAALGEANCGQQAGPVSYLPMPTDGPRQSIATSPVLLASVQPEGAPHVPGTLHLVLPVQGKQLEHAARASTLHGADINYKVFGNRIAQLAVAPLLNYVECQHWLEANDPAGADVNVQQFTQAVQQHIVTRCLCSNEGALDASMEVQLGYR